MKWKPTNIPMENWGADVPEDSDLGVAVPLFKPKESTQEAINKRIAWEEQHKVKTETNIKPLPPNLKPAESPNIKTIEHPNLKPSESPKKAIENTGRCYP